ncbi:conserved exported hypothetical protein [Vibrio jasicida]|uniref:DUF4165 domain-containing protein n=1 Tax=Vibrio jasicida TaxID=766224 RepID=A0AAU9QRI4_9VIBR|nr:conserved exported hypothetical protein [Vibrio jasicida]CAH1599162.1 conserved exported hypothetical protein [Vibrio jasicida]
MRNTKSIVALALASLYSCSLFAAVEGVNYIDPLGIPHDAELAVNDSNFLNNQGELTLYISAGLDRRIRLTTSVNGTALKTETTNIINIQDKIEYDGNSFYGVMLNAPVSGDGSYTLLIETLNLSGEVVTSENLFYTRDTTLPNAGTLSASGYGGYTGHTFQPSNTWFFTNYFSNFIQVNGISDSSGIEKVEMLTYTMSPKTLYKTRVLAYSESTKSARFTFSEDYGFLPANDNGETIRGVAFRVTDKAGNQSLTDVQNVIYDTYKTGDLKLVGIYDPQSTATIAGQRGFVPYNPGMTVKTNPIQFMYRVSNSNYTSNVLGGIGFVGADKVITTQNDGYTYAVYKRPYGYTDGNYVRFNQRATWSAGGISYNLILSDSAPKAPSRNGMFEYNYSDKGWASANRWDMNISELPVRIKGVRQFVAPRTYPQVFSHSGYSCTIPAGATVCEIAFPDTSKWNLVDGGHYYFHEGSSITSADGALYGPPMWANVTYNAAHAPVINSTVYDSESKILTVSITQSAAGSWFDHLRLGNVWLEDSTKGTLLSTYGDKCTRQTTEYSCTFDLSSLSEGSYSYVVKAQERHGLTTTGAETLTYVSDRTAPIIKWGYKDSYTVPSTITDLRDLKFAISDLSVKKVDELRITGSTFDVNYLLGYSKLSSTETAGVINGVDVYSLELPKLFPTMEVNEHYKITLTASDEYGNSTISTIDVVFIPENLVQLDVQSYLPVAQNLLDADDEPIARIYTESSLVLEGAQMATGVQLAEITVDPNAGGALNFLTTDGVVTINPGETRVVSIDLGTTGGALNIDVYPAKGEKGTAKFMFSIPQLSSMHNK